MDFVISVGEKLPEGLWIRFPDNPVKAQCASLIPPR